MRILLSADWQIGMRFRQFGAKATWLRAVRVRTLGRVLTLAAERAMDAVVIAGDLFEDHQIDPAEVAEVFALLERHAAARIFILPGNHDPVGSPSAIWARRPFAQPPPHVTVFTGPQAVEVAGGWLLANPLTQKESALDPSAPLADLARTLLGSNVKIGFTHGSPAIASLHQPNDFPIAPDAATRAGLDFLGLGHWHSALTLDGGRMLMTGTPEPASFSESASGFVHEIEITEAGALPRITPSPAPNWLGESTPGIGPVPKKPGCNWNARSRRSMAPRVAQSCVRNSAGSHHRGRCRPSGPRCARDWRPLR